MGQIQQHRPVLFLCAIISRYQSAHQWAEEKLIQNLGPIGLASESFEFKETSFYEATMGTELRKRFVAFESHQDPQGLADFKRQTNAWENEYAESFEHPEPRPLNLDPGYISDAKLVLATTKDRDHRIYLRDGIFAEVTLHYKRTGWSANPWTYPNYQREDFQDFFTECRKKYRGR